MTKATKRCELETWSSIFKDGGRLCVDCQKSAMRKALGYRYYCQRHTATQSTKFCENKRFRCKGQGLLNTETRWSAMLVHGCHGKWLLTSREPECRCGQKDQHSMIFVWRTTDYVKVSGRSNTKTPLSNNLSLNSSLSRSQTQLIWRKRKLQQSGYFLEQHILLTICGLKKTPLWFQNPQILPYTALFYRTLPNFVVVTSVLVGFN